MNPNLPKIYNDIFEDNYFNNLKKYLSAYDFGDNAKKDHYGSLRLMSLEGDEMLLNAQDKVYDIAKDIFLVDDIVPSYCTYARYFGNQPILSKHVDQAPTTYLLDVCLSYKTNWSIFVENKEFYVEENQGLAFYAGEQVHWRPDFPDPENNCVEVLMFGFISKDHIWWKIKEKERLGIVKRFLNTSPEYNKNIYSGP